ncbi:MAG: hypothetical protein LBT70_02010, partial [Holosporaceae bacterium]|nr:hypothetical protein [Holosporaceae bacterium]
IEIVYAGGVFVLKFEGENKVFICTSIDGISWKLVKVEDFPGFFCFSGIVGGPLGFVYKGEGSRLYYSPSGNDWAEVTLPEWPGGEVDHTSEGFARVLYVASSFYGDMFIALPYRGEYALLGTQGKEGITWSWINLNISFSGMPVGSQNIRYISCVGKKIIIDGQKTEDQGQDLGFRAQL